MGAEVDTWEERGYYTSAECVAECAAEVEVDRILGDKVGLSLPRRVDDALCHWL